MAGRIPQTFIDDLMNRVDVVEIIDARVPLKKAGKEYKACCPFHGEKTPSFTVSSSKQFYHCFGCGAHGTAISFLMEYEHLSFPEAIEELAHQSGLSVPREASLQDDQTTAEIRQKHDLYDLMTAAKQYYQQQLRQHSTSKIAIEYLKNRGLSGEIAAEFGIGFAPDGWHNLNQVLSSAGYSQTQQIDSGMLIQNDAGKTYDRFRARIMFPIHDQRGRCIGFGGRVINSDDKGAKYLNSPETPLFHKGQELYGLYEARQFLRKIERLLVVEGYMDVVSVAQFDIRYAVATLGTATTSEHLHKLFRLSEQIIFCFDGDRAGKEAAWRALENALPVMREGFELRFMFLPDGQDPDTEIRNNGKAAFEAEIANAQTFSQYLFDTLAKDLDLKSIDGRARLVQHAKPYLAQLPKGIYLQMMLKHLSKLAMLDVTDINLSNNNSLKQENQQSEYRNSSRPKSRIANNSNQPLSPIRTLITLLLHKPKLALLAQDTSALTKLTLPGVELLLSLILLVQQNPKIGISAIIERYRDSNSAAHLQKLTTQTILVDDDALDAEFIGALELLNKNLKETRADQLLQLAEHGSLSETENNELKQLLKEI
ncbi:DNA primase [hydrothermal vent metagenome]|uniref:DNA primase n=1 Tax=hydrothermal vent metagenome TaxID=652676 RepID=A0A3B1AJ37_9ZZZZ